MFQKQSVLYRTNKNLEGKNCFTKKLFFSENKKFNKSVIWQKTLGMSYRIASIAIFVAFLIPFSLVAQSTTNMSNEVIQMKSGPISVEHLATLNEPWGMAFLPDGRLLITEKAGNLRIYQNGKLSEPISGVPKVAYGGQGGMFDVEIDPDFAHNSLVYFTYAEAAEKQPKAETDIAEPRLGQFQNVNDVVLKGGALARGKLEGGDLKNVKVIWRQEPKTIGRGQYGGRLVFTPDGKLFITSGERQRFDPAQDMSSNLGKIVRINSDGSIPEDNPFLNKKGVSPDIWSLGHRNPLGAALNPMTKLLWVNEMGPLQGDELNIAEPGRNYGWPIVSNGNNYDNTPIPNHSTRTEFVPPIFYWHPSIAPSGMIFYTGTRFVNWSGSVLIGGLITETLNILKLKGNNIVSEERIPLHRRIRDVIQAPDGAVWLLTDEVNGELLRISPASH